MNKPLLWFVKVTGWPINLIKYHKKIYYEDGNKKLRNIKGPALIISNHTSVWDYPLIMETFWKRDLRFLIASTTAEKSKKRNWFMKQIGGIKVDRESFDFSFMDEVSKVLRKKCVCVIFPESRLHQANETEEVLLDFKPSYVYLALQNNVPIIPVYVNGMYGKKRKINKERGRIVVGKPILASILIDKTISDQDNVANINNIIKSKINSLKQLIKKDEK